MGHAYQPPACCAYRRRRAACPEAPRTVRTAVRVPASGVPIVPRTVWCTTGHPRTGTTLLHSLLLTLTLTPTLTPTTPTLTLTPSQVTHAQGPPCSTHCS